jgi:diguanylate cyclase (GGDEF)-like protein/PAS domain S-box-containing protein
MNLRAESPGRLELSLRRLSASLAHPPLREQRFWFAQSLVLIAVALYSLGDVLQRHGVIPLPGFVWILALLPPVVYAGTAVGLAGSLGAAVTGSILTIPTILVTTHESDQLWGAWSDLVIVLVVAVVVGQRYESMRSTAARSAMVGSIALDDQRFRLAFEDNMGAMAVVGLDGRVLRVNDALEEFLERPREQIVGTSMMDFTHPDDLDKSRELNRRLDSGEADQVRIIKRYVRGDGSIAIAEVSKSVAKDEFDRPLFAITSIRDITDQQVLTDQLAHQALHDSLTGLANRTLLSDRMDHSLERLRRRGGLVALFLLDLDNFKEVNDTLGHLVGDSLLSAIASRLERMVRVSDTVSRFGGDEFVYFAEDVVDLNDVHTIAARLQAVFTEPFILSGHVLRQGVSIGVVVCGSQEERSGDDMFRDADIAMYEAKRLGRDRYVVFDNEMSKRSSLHFKLSQDLKLALSRRELSMHYQPFVNLNSGEVLGFEALMRWRHPQEGLVSPEVFIPLAEQSDLVRHLGVFALETATFEGAQWRELTPTVDGPYIGVNLSARQFHDPHLFEIVKRVLSESGLAANRLALEVTESVALSDVDTTIGVLDQLKRLEVVTALDDFGTGYSSLAYLARLRPDVIKIDRSFIAAALDSTFDERVLESLITLCHRLDMLVLAEGVETDRQLALLRQMGCSLGQGFLFSPAVPAEEVVSLSGSVAEHWRRATASTTVPGLTTS